MTDTPMQSFRPFHGLFLLCLSAWWGLAAPAQAAEVSGTEVVDRAEGILWGKTMQGDVDMVIVTPTWSKTLNLKMWMDRPTRSFARVIGPAKEAGISSLRIGAEMWNYIPSIERTVKIPPSLMLQPWFGSDFSNDDMVKEASYVNDYTHKIVAEIDLDGQKAYQVEALPKPNAAVVWGKVVFEVRKADFIPLRTSFYDERSELVRVMQYSDVRMLGGRLTPTRWKMQPQRKPGNSTTVVLKVGVYDKPIAAEVFSLRNLTQKD